MRSGSIHSTGVSFWPGAIAVLVMFFITPNNTYASEYRWLLKSFGNSVVEWPVGADDSLPLAGIFYGNAQAGTATTNSRISIKSSRRFRAQKTGAVRSVRFHNRVLSQKDINKKCKRQGKESAWCKCKDAGLDELTCGYTIGSSYSVGNGGLIELQLVHDNGFGLPDENNVISSSDTFIPLELSKKSSSHYVNQTFNQPANLQAGNVYHLLFKNLNPPLNCALSRVPVEQAAQCPKDKGAISINGIYDNNQPSQTGRWGPMYGSKGAASLYWDSNTSQWREFEKGLSFYELHYSDGVSVGESYHALDALNIGQNEIQGKHVARQRFTVYGASRRVTGVWVNFGHGNLADGSAANVKLLDNNNQQLAFGELAASLTCMSAAQKKCRDWGYVPFASTIDLAVGSEYSLEIGAGSAGGFLLSAYRTLKSHGFDDINYWDNAVAELSTNNGKSWKKWSSKNSKYRDLPVLFTIDGMPNQLP